MGLFVCVCVCVCVFICVCVECVSLTVCVLICTCPICPLRCTCADFPRWGRGWQEIQLDEVEEVSLFFTVVASAG